MDLGLRKARSVVVGASRGLGRGVAELLAEEGSDVAVLGRTVAGLDKTVGRLRDKGAADAFAVAADIGDGASVERAFSEIKERWGAINVLINNAANSAGTRGRTADLGEEVWIDAFNRITVGYVRCVRAALPLLRKAEWARIVNLSTQATKRQGPAIGVYVAAKSAVTSFSKHLARELAGDGILVNTVSPGPIMVTNGDWGPINEEFHRRGLDPKSPQDAVELWRQLNGVPAPDLGRAGWVSEYAPVVVFAASRLNGFMTGANLNVDGGTDFS